MGKSKQTKEKKFNRDVEISAPYLDPEIIKAIHSPPNVDPRHAGFKALLSDLHSQDSTDEMMPLNDSHVPSYIGISCAVSGYTHYNKHLTEGSNLGSSITPNRSRPTSPVLIKSDPPIHHIIIDKKNLQSPDDERRELTEKLTASANETLRISSPCIPPTEDDRHHGAYVGARYCPLPSPNHVVNKHIPLLGIDDNEDSETKAAEEANKVEKSIASLYGDEFKENWLESMSHRAKKEKTDEQIPKKVKSDAPTKSKPTDLTGKAKNFFSKIFRHSPTQQELDTVDELAKPVERPASPTSELSKHIDKPEKLAADLISQEVKPVKLEEKPSNEKTVDQGPQAESHSPVAEVIENTADHNIHDPLEPENVNESEEIEHDRVVSSVQESEPITQRQQIVGTQELVDSDPGALHSKEPENEVENPKLLEPQNDETRVNESLGEYDEKKELHSKFVEDALPETEITDTREPEKDDKPVLTSISERAESFQLEKTEPDLVRFSPEPASIELEQQAEPIQIQSEEEETNILNAKDQFEERTLGDEPERISEDLTSQDGRYYLDVLDKEKSFIKEKIAEAEDTLSARESELDEDTIGKLRSAIGKANLLINKKCQQFVGLCEANINKDSNDQFEIHNDDLAGFWDMLSIQFSDVRKCFETVWEQPEEKSISAIEENEKSREKTHNGSKPKLSAQKDQERRERLKEHINQMKQTKIAATNNEGDHIVSSESPSAPSKLLESELQAGEPKDSPGKAEKADEAQDGDNLLNFD